MAVWFSGNGNRTHQQVAQGRLAIAPRQVSSVSVVSAAAFGGLHAAGPGSVGPAPVGHQHLEVADVNDAGDGVSYATSDDTAIDGTDYAATFGAVTFAAGETSKSISIPLLNNPAVTGDRTLTLTLTNPTGGVALATPSTATLTIKDKSTDTNPDNGQTTKKCGAEVGPANLLTFYALCWAGLLGMRYRTALRKRARS